MRYEQSRQSGGLINGFPCSHLMPEISTGPPSKASLERDMEQRKDIPAFPNSNGNTPGLEAYSGMTLRDYFAAEALPIARAQVGPNHNGWRTVAETAYAIADAMLAAREK